GPGAAPRATGGAGPQGAQAPRRARGAGGGGGADAEHTITAFTFLGVGEAAAPALRDAVAGHAQWLGRDESATFAAGGTAAEAAAALRALGAAGAQTVVVRVCGPEPLAQLREVLAALGR
ncbi:5,10-methylene tetrahydromethanopterin reductase, partial [Kitasatospora sp. NPDC049285]